MAHGGGDQHLREGAAPRIGGHRVAQAEQLPVLRADHVHGGAPGGGATHRWQGRKVQRRHGGVLPIPAAGQTGGGCHRFALPGW
ncbi:hypothetical protein GCM10012284_42990 [Mangrovihabitans endophyticus]|uniref:Uncharacterized protein n=1 Tax=Mangrovihabitans endophyticus TaxID=1751298 RepID=A0A8J3FQ20_9ACTN|nr:hypothetical protein GCM10012284_42990 [Mangrovihabitans endophyticus]